jgi:hypothetical protein
MIKKLGGTDDLKMSILTNSIVRITNLFQFALFVSFGRKKKRYFRAV